MRLDGGMFSIATVNVNGIRAAFRRGMAEWIDQQAPDVILMQEVRASDEILDGYFDSGWHLLHEAGAAKGRAGVAIASRLPLGQVRVGLAPQTRPEDQIGRWVEADLDVAGTPLTIVSTYIHSGTVGTPSMPQKYAFLDAVTTRLGELADQGGCAVVAGDVNIGDRKSTRLNSSHVSISYAVFCLKKKNYQVKAYLCTRHLARTGSTITHA